MARSRCFESPPCAVAPQEPRLWTQTVCASLLRAMLYSSGRRCNPVPPGVPRRLGQGKGCPRHGPAGAACSGTPTTSQSRPLSDEPRRWAGGCQPESSTGSGGCAGLAGAARMPTRPPANDVETPAAATTVGWVEEGGHPRVVRFHHSSLFSCFDCSDLNMEWVEAAGRRAPRGGGVAVRPTAGRGVSRRGPPEEKGVAPWVT